MPGRKLLEPAIFKVCLQAVDENAGFVPPRLARGPAYSKSATLLNPNGPKWGGKLSDMAAIVAIAQEPYAQSGRLSGTKVAFPSNAFDRAMK